MNNDVLRYIMGIITGFIGGIWFAWLIYIGFKTA